MDSEQKALKRIEKAQKAKWVIEQEPIREAFDYLDREFIELWGRSGTTEGRENIWRARQTLIRVKELLAKAISDGEVSKADLRRIEEDRRTQAA